ncbi:DNA repair protein RecN [Thermodesulfobacteriota bacterium]
MLQDLSIRNFAIIDDLKISFGDGLTILSGETGAGKSIVINAVNLLLGGRATSKLVRTGAKTAELEALFKIRQGSKTAEILETNGYEAGPELLIRRIISRSDRHRIYVNGRLATTHLLISITENLSSISGQHAHQGLLKEEQHLLILDQFGGLLPLRAEVTRYFQEIITSFQKLQNLRAKKERQSEHLELLEFQKKEILAASITPGEDTALEREKNRLRNAEVLFKAVEAGIEELYSSQGAVIERLVTITKQLENAGRIDAELSGKAENLTDIVYRLEDVTEELRRYIENLSVDEPRLEAVEARLDALQRFKRKYGGSLDAVLSYLESVEQELSGVENITSEITAIESILSERHQKIVVNVRQLSEKRKQTADIFSKEVERGLISLKMPGTKFKVTLDPVPGLKDCPACLKTGNQPITEAGIDRAAFLISPNVGEELKPLTQIASGGELSRVILALKAILAKTDSIETIVFDEVDAGIGGGVAEVVGKKLSTLARYHQIICITHLPQIAKYGDHHYKISKQISGGRVKTMIDPLYKEDRVKEIARMLGGVKITRTTIDHAREMLKRT